MMLPVFTYLGYPQGGCSPIEGGDAIEDVHWPMFTD